MDDNATFGCTDHNTFTVSYVVIAINFFIVPCFSILGIIGNVAFLATIIRLKGSQSGLNTYLCHLAVCDILFLSSSLYWILQSAFSTKPNVVFSLSYVCVGYVLSTHVLYFASIELNTVISVERYFAICVPLRHRLVVGRKRTMKLLIFVWLSATIGAMTIIPSQSTLGYLCYVWQQQESDDLTQIVPICGPRSVYWEYYAIIFILLLFFLTFSLNSALYVNIIKALHERTSMMTRSSSEPESNQQPPQLQTSTSFQLEAENIRNQVARTLVASGIIFFITQTPMRLLTLEALLDKSNNGVLDSRQYDVLDMISNVGLFFNSIINPYLYFASCRYYRDAFRNSFKCK